MGSPIHFKSFSRALMTGITTYRNQPGLINKIEAQIGYAALFVIGSVEAIAAGFFGLFIILTCAPIEHYKYPVDLGDSSMICTVWAIIYFILNPFTEQLPSNEENALHALTDIWPIDHSF